MCIRDRGETVAVAVVQGSYKPEGGQREYEDYNEDKMQHYMELVDGTADITVFPETELGA